MDKLELKSTPNNKIPKGARVETVITRDGVHLRAVCWQPTKNLNEKGEPRGTICLFSGRTEFIEKYYEVIEELRERGFVVATLDWRGQGLSQRLLRNPFRGHVRSFNHYHRDLDAFLTKFVSRNCPSPYFALAHSMGGHILFSQARGGLSRFFDRMILTAPMLHLAPRMLFGLHWLSPGRNATNHKIVSQRTTRLLTRFIRFCGFGWAYVFGGGDEIIHAFKGNLITSDEKRFDRFNELLAAHPELGIGSATNSWLNSACGSMKKILKFKYIRAIDVPILIVASGADQIVSTTSIEKITTKMRAGHHIIINNARHEIMLESDEFRNQFWAAFDAFIPGEASKVRDEEEKIRF